MKTNRAKVVTITSRKGGAGKTAITSLLARYLVEIEKRKVLVVDFDGRGGITSLFHHDPITATTPSIVEYLMEAYQQKDLTEIFSQSTIQINTNRKFNWKDNGGSLYLLPSKPILDNFLTRVNFTLLRTALKNLNLPQEYIILIDSGPDHQNIKMTIAASDIVFVPMILSKQDVHPTVETLGSIHREQISSGNAALGALIVNRVGVTQWEESYITNYQKLLNKFQNESQINTLKKDWFIRLKQSRIIQRGKHLSWSWRDDILESVNQIAEVIHDY
jgi:cellulose biosynthesis protein BcsQ